MKRRKNQEKAKIPRKQVSERGKNLGRSRIQRKAKIWRRQKYGGVKNQEEARNERIPNFSLYGPGRHRLKEGLLFPLHTKPTIPFQGYAQCSLNIVNMFNYDWILIATFFNRGNRFNHHGIMMQRIMLNLNSKTCLKTFMS